MNAPTVDTLVIESGSPDRTAEVGRAVGEMFSESEVLCLSGPLGAGKTQFVKGLALGIGVPGDEPVVSPTFVLVREYTGRLRLYHIDAYRLSGAGELLALGFEEMTAQQDAVVVIEWADRVEAALPPSSIRIEFEHVGQSERRLTVQWPLTPAVVAAHAAAGLEPRPLDRLAERLGLDRVRHNPGVDSGTGSPETTRA
jgi:tRNA threonylcarbamoyladenosine biosynthesis protein TsaE